MLDVFFNVALKQKGKLIVTMNFFSNQTNRMDRKNGRHFVFAVDKNGTIHLNKYLWALQLIRS